MIISLNWLRDFVELPAGLDPQQLALKFTMTTAEVDGVEHHTANFHGLVTGRIESLERVAGEEKLQRVTLQAGQRFVTLSAAPNLKAGDVVVYGPPGASVGGHKLGETDPGGRTSPGMIIAGQGIGLTQVGTNAIFLPPRTEPGSQIDAGLFDDWLIEIDNKSITHRPDLWGHYGIAREVAAILDLPLKPYPTTDPREMVRVDLPAIPIEIDDPRLAPRYTGLLMTGLTAQPAPLWMQVRLAMVGMRPIDLMVDLTNYIMAELGQPMHAFDGAAMPNIQVATAALGERFTTLDGVTRTMPPGTLMIQSNRKSVAIAGIMGGAATEVSAKTTTVLLESANFDAATIRRAATAMGHRTEASARFEKSLDPEYTVLGIARFHNLAKAELPALTLASTLSDCYPAPKQPQPIELDCDFAAKFIGKDISREEMTRILSKIEFRCEANARPHGLCVTPPTFRATKDITIEADLIEEIARFVGYDNIEPTLPNVAARFFEPSPELIVEERTLDHLCVGGEFAEVHDYIWHDDDWNKTLAFDPGECIALKNPAAENCAKLRRTLVPGLIAFVERNRHTFQRFQLVEIGSVFHSGRDVVEKAQHRSMGLVVAQSGKQADSVVWDRLRTALDGWARQVLESPLEFRDARAVTPWEDPDRIAELAAGAQLLGRISILPLACKLKIDERLKAWSVAIAELNLSSAAELLGRYEKLPAVPRFPQVQLDFSVMTDTSRLYNEIAARLAEFKHPLLRRFSFVDSYEGKAIPEGKRSLTLRANIGADDRTLSDTDAQNFQQSFRTFLTQQGLELRG